MYTFIAEPPYLTSFISVHEAKAVRNRIQDVPISNICSSSFVFTRMEISRIMVKV